MTSTQSLWDAACGHLQWPAACTSEAFAALLYFQYPSVFRGFGRRQQVTFLRGRRGTLMAYFYRKVSDLKNRARKIAREEQIPRHVALDRAALRGGFQNYAHALSKLPYDAAAPARHSIEIVQSWAERDPRQRGMARAQIALTTPLVELIKSHHLVENLNGCRLEGENRVISSGWMRDAKESVYDVAKVARTIQFMDATGLKPSSARRCYPKGDWTNRPPIADHDNCWFDPEAKVHLLSIEPYPGRADSINRQQKAWEDEHSWVAVLVKWGSVYGHGTEVYLLCPTAYAPTLSRKVAALEASLPAIGEANLYVDPRQ